MEDAGYHYLMCAALKFGTTHSGYACSTKDDFIKEPLMIRSRRCWEGAEYSNIYSCKTPTCLLLDKEKQFVAFGFDAEKRYAELVMDEEQDDYYFFDRFTMSLHNNKNVTRDMVLKDKTGKQCSAVEVFTLSIKAFVDDLMKQMEKGSLKLHDVLWVLTVSASWTDGAKQLMRESAERAGLQPEMLLLVTEPEASFTYCHYISTTKRHRSSNPAIMIKEPGTKYMVVDLGDVTADITVLQSTYNGQLKELFRVSGDDCGSTSIFDRFCKILAEIVGGNVIAESKKQHPSDWLVLLQDFRIRTTTFTTLNTKVLCLKYPVCLTAICKELYGEDLTSFIDSSSYVNEITLLADKFKLKADLIMKLFTPTIESIINLMKTTLTNRSTNGLSNILMVGGLSEYHMIKYEVMKAFPEHQIIIPYNADMSVLLGAVLFGHRPDYNRSELCDEENIGK